MHKTLTALALAATIAVAAVAAPQAAEARDHGGAVAAGIIGGLAAGAIIGSAAANNGYYGDDRRDCRMGRETFRDPNGREYSQNVMMCRGSDGVWCPDR